MSESVANDTAIHNEVKPGNAPPPEAPLRTLRS